MLLFYYTQYMSQVIRKFKEAGKIEQAQPELFERSGVGKYNKKELVSGLLRNMDTYAQNNNLSGDRAAAFKDAAVRMIKGIENGTGSIDEAGNYVDSTGTMSSTGKFDKGFLGRVKNTENNAFGIAGHYILDYLNQTPTYKEQEPAKKLKFNPNELIEKEISKRWYGGANIDYDNFFKRRSEADRTSILADIANTVDYNKIYDEHDWEGSGIDSADTFANRFKAFGQALSNNTFDDDDYNTFASLGGSNLNKWFKQAPGKEASDKRVEQEAAARAAGYTTEESINAFINELERREADKNQEMVDTDRRNTFKRDMDKYFDEYQSQNPFNSNVGAFLPQANTTDRLRKGIWDYIDNTYGKTIGASDTYFNKALSRDRFSNLQHAANNIAAAMERLKFPDAGDGFVAIPSTFNFDNWTTYVYNPKTREYRETSMLANEALKKIAHGKYREMFEKKDGGTIKMQFGGKYSTASGQALVGQQLSDKKKAEEAEKNKPAENDTRTPEQIKEGNRKPSDDLQWDDYTRLGAIAADVVSMVPGLGLAGVGSSAANFAADLKDGVQWKDFGNLGINLGLDLVGMVPGLGAAAKGSRVLKNLLKWTPRVLTILAAKNYAGPALQSFGKVTRGETLTVDDWRNIAEGLKLVIQGGKGVKKQIQKRIISKNAKTGNTVVDLGDGTEKTLTPSQLADVKSHKGLADQQAALQLHLNDDNLKLVRELRDFSWKRPTTWNEWTRYRNDYDFDRKKMVMTSKGPKEVPIITSRAGQNVKASMTQNVWSIPGINQAIMKYNDWRYRKFEEGGKVRKFDNGNVMNRNVKNKANPYLKVGNTSSNARNLDLWDTYYDSDKQAKDILANKSLGHLDSQTVASTLNVLNSSKLPWTKKLNDTGYKPWNEQFDTLGLNDTYFGKDVSRFDQQGPTTWARKALLSKLQSTYNSSDNPLTTKDGSVYFNGKEWISDAPLAVSKPSGVTGDSVADITAGTKAVTEAKAATPQTTDNSVVKYMAPKQKRFDIGVLPEDTLALGRMVGGLATNNRVASIYKNSIKPTLLDTFENTVPLQGDYASKSVAEKQAGDLESLASKPRTSDASLQLAGQLDVGSKASQIRMQGNLADSEKFYQTRMLGQQESDAAKARRVQTTNQNRASINAISAAKGQIDAGRVAANYQQVVAPYMAGVENQFRQNTAMRKQYDLESSLNNLSNEYDTNYNALLTKYKDQPEVLEKELKKLRSKAGSDSIRARRSLIGSPWMFSRTPTDTTRIPYSERGSKLTYKEKANLQRAKDFNKRLSEDNKQFHKDIMDSKKEHNKLLTNMSALTATLIKKGMDV